MPPLPRFHISPVELCAMHPFPAGNTRCTVYQSFDSADCTMEGSSG